MKLRSFHRPMSSSRMRFCTMFFAADAGSVGIWRLEAKSLGGSLGEIAQGRRGIQPHQAGDHLVEGAVSSGCHHQIVSGALPGGGIGRVSWGGGLVDPDEGNPRRRGWPARQTADRGACSARPGD